MVYIIHRFGVNSILRSVSSRVNVADWLIGVIKITCMQSRKKNKWNF